MKQFPFKSNQIKKDDLQSVNQIRLLNQRKANSLTNSNKMAKWKGLDKITVKLPIFSVKVHVVQPLPVAGPSLTMKTAPLLHRNVSKYNSQYDMGHITVVVYVIGISLHNKDRRLSGGSTNLGSVGVSQQTLLQISPEVINPVHINKSIGPLVLAMSIASMKPLRLGPMIPMGKDKDQGLFRPNKAPNLHQSNVCRLRPTTMLVRACRQDTKITSKDSGDCRLRLSPSPPI